MSLLDIKEAKSLKRDLDNFAIINTDEDSYEQYMKRHNSILNEKRNAEQRINKIEQDVSFIKDALMELLKAK